MVSERLRNRTLVEEVPDHLWAIQAVYIFIYFYILCIVKLDVDAGRFVGRFTKLLSPRSPSVSKGRKKVTEKQWDEDHKRISVARDVHESWKNECMCIFVGHGLRLTSFALVVAKKSEIPICSARISLTYPSSFCQAGIRTTAGDPWLCKLQRSKHELRHRQIHTGF